MTNTTETLPKGVKMSPTGKFWARGRVGGEVRHVGTYNTAEEAAAAFLQACEEAAAAPKQPKPPKTPTEDTPVTEQNVDALAERAGFALFDFGPAYENQRRRYRYAFITYLPNPEPEDYTQVWMLPPRDHGGFCPTKAEAYKSALAEKRRIVDWERAVEKPERPPIPPVDLIDRGWLDAVWGKYCRALEACGAPESLIDSTYIDMYPSSGPALDREWARAKELDAECRHQVLRLGGTGFWGCGPDEAAGRREDAYKDEAGKPITDIQLVMKRAAALFKEEILAAEAAERKARRLAAGFTA